MASDLYSRDILRLAASLPHGDTLEYSDGSAELRAPLCGSSMRVEAALTGSRVIGIAITAHACALGQASAAILRLHAPGAEIASIISIRNQLAEALSGTADMPVNWPELLYLAPARKHTSRHGAILLPYDALIEAANMAQIMMDDSQADA